MNYKLHSLTEVKVMHDGSGIVLYSGLSGRSAFLQNKDPRLNCAHAHYQLKFDRCLQNFDVRELLFLDDDSAINTEKWLLRNKFVCNLEN